MRNIPEKIIAASVSINGDKSRGSGALINVKNRIYLVTAKHVLYSNINGNFELYSNNIIISCPTTIQTDSDTRKYSINLNKKNTKYNTTHDVAIVFLAKWVKNDENSGAFFHEDVVETQSTNNKPLILGEQIFKKLNEVILSNDAYIFGFPTSLGIDNYTDFFDTNKPILRRGIISHINTLKKHIIIDCPVYAGNSGGPVFEVRIDENGKKKYYFIGIISRYIPYKQEWHNVRDNYRTIEYVNSGYSLVIPIDIIIETINNK